MATDWQQALPKDAALSPSHRLWVPMLMQALVFGTEGSSSFIDLTPRYEALLDPEEAPLGARLRPALDREQSSPAYLEPGIHLHWSLPATFAHVRPVPLQAGAPASASTYQLVPDRWLVTRMWESGDGRLSAKSWVVESDYRDPDNGAAPWLDGAGSGYRVTRLGRSVALEDWTPSPTPAPSLSAVAPGNLAFAAFYPSCRGVFGFHDDAADLPAGTVCSYLVAGWFADERVDPLNLGSKQEWLARMRELQWAVADDTRFLPTHLTCHAAIRGVTWAPDAPCDDPSGSPVEVALGNGPLEAIAALSRDPRRGDFDALAARLRNQLQLAALASRRPTMRDLDRPDGPGGLFKEIGRFAGLRARLHERTFAAQTGGTVWEIVERQNGESAHNGNARNDKEARDLAAARRRLFAVCLRTLNDRQRDCDETARELAGARRRLFAAWYQRQYWTTLAGTTDDERTALGLDLGSRVDDARKEVERLATDLSQDAAKLAESRRAIEQALRRKLPDHELVARAMPRFWRASDPFVALAGVPVPEVQGGTSPLACRVSDQTVSRLRIENVPTYGTIQITRADLRQKVQQLLSPLANAPGDVPELLLDLMLADRSAAGLLARIYWVPHYANPRPEQIAAVRTEIEQAQARIETGAALVRQGGSAGGLPIDCGGSTPARSFLAALNLPSTTACGHVPTSGVGAQGAWAGPEVGVAGRRGCPGGGHRGSSIRSGHHNTTPTEGDHDDRGDDRTAFDAGKGHRRRAAARDDRLCRTAADGA